MTVVHPQVLLDYWIGDADQNPDLAKAKNKLWFQKSEATDADIAALFSPTMGALSAGLAHDWAIEDPKHRLAAIIALDQFSRNVFRDTPGAFENDPLALALSLDGMERGEDTSLAEVERMFTYLPLEHSEDPDMQTLSIEKFTQLAAEARPEFQALADNVLDYAHQHKDVIDEFGRFPHRNAILGRESTPDELAYLAKPGAGF